MIKVLYLPLNSPEITQTGMYDAFNTAGVNLKIFDFNRLKLDKDHLNKKLIQESLSFKPDLIHAQFQFTDSINPHTIKIIKKSLPNVIVSQWSGDVRVNVPNTYVNMAQVVDFSLISSTGQIDMYKKATNCNNIKYWQIGYDPKKYYALNNSTFKYYCSFAASNHRHFPDSVKRAQAVKTLRNKFKDKFGLFGLSWGDDTKYVPQAMMNEIYNDSVCCLSISNFNNISHYFSDRLLMAMASGRPVISLTFPGWEDYFTNNKNIVIVNSVDEIPRKVQWLVDNPDIANEIGKAGSKIVQAEHTYYSRVKELLHIVGLL